MNMNAIKQVYKFNEDAGLLNQGYDDQRECAFPIEEALEGLDYGIIASALENGGLYLADARPKDIGRCIASAASSDAKYMKDVDRLDKHLDIIIFSLGSIFKLGLSPQQAMKALGIVATANMAKIGADVDEHGKAKKGAYWKAPEPELQKILNEVKEQKC